MRYMTVLLLAVTVLLLAMLGFVVCGVLGILYPASARVCRLSERLPIICVICFVVVVLVLLAVSAARNDNKGMGDLLNGMWILCLAICILCAVALGIYCVEGYRPGIGAACVCLAFFGIQFGCFLLASHKFKKMAPKDSRAYRRFRKNKFYAMLLVAVIVLVTCSALFAPEEETRQVFGVFAGPFVSLMVFTQMADVYMIEVPKEAPNHHDASRVAKMNRLHRSRRAANRRR